jgi:DNA repair protein RadC
MHLPHFQSYTPRIRLEHLPIQERPTRRVAEQPAACNLIELLATLIGGSRQMEIAEALLVHFGSLRAIRQAHADEIATAIHGVGSQTAIRLVAALELGQRLACETVECPVIHSPRDAAALILHEMSTYEQEHLRVILLNARNRVIGIEDIYRGSVSSAQVRVGEIFKSAIRRNASAVILAHNHPSGDPSPSPDDVTITQAFVQAGELLDIQALDHLVIGHGRFVSLKERNLGFA